MRCSERAVLSESWRLHKINFVCCVKFEVFKAVTPLNLVFCHLISCSTIGGYQRFRRRSCLYPQSTFSWILSLRISGISVIGSVATNCHSSFIYEPAENYNEIFRTEYLQNLKIQIEFPHQKQNNILQCKRCQAYGVPKVTAHTDQDVWNVANHTAPNDVLYHRHNQQHAIASG
jgi:hypothetical protein